MGFKTSLKSAEGHQLIANLASAFGIDEQNADTAVEALDRELRARIERNMLSRGGVADVLSLVTQPAAASALSEPRDLASPNLAENGNHILDVLIGNKHISRGIAARAASEARLDPGTVEKLLPVVASLMIGQLQRQSQPELEKLVQNVPASSARAAAHCRCPATTSLASDESRKDRRCHKIPTRGCRTSCAVAAALKFRAAARLRKSSAPSSAICLEAIAASSER